MDFIYDNEDFIDLYNILNVDSTAQNTDIKLSYLQLVKLNHPDHGGNSDLFLEITKAYEILSKKDLRKEYDLYYLKKNYEEFKEENIFQLKTDFKNFVMNNTKILNEETITKLHDEIFKEKHEIKESMIGEDEILKRINELNIERQNSNIDMLDDKLYNLINTNNDITLNDIFEYNSINNNSKNEIITKEIGTLDLLPSHLTTYSSFINNVEQCDSNLYADINYDIKPNLINELELENINNWKLSKKVDRKLTICEIDNFVENRKKDEDDIINNITKNLQKSNKKNELKKFIKNDILENFENTKQINNIKKRDYKI